MKKQRLSASSRLGLAVLAAAVLAGCGGGGGSTSTSEVAPPPQSPPPASQERTVLPSTIDPQVSAGANNDHVFINPNPDVTAQRRLFVMLAGTRGSPTLYREVLRSGARRGFHTLGLDYPNPEAVGDICARSADTACFWNVRREVITGTNLSADIDIALPDAIVTRLTKALVYLNATYPTEGWGQYLSGNAVDWSKVIVAGHSQGGGHAGVIAKLSPVSRAVYFASPADWNLRTDAPADWVSFAGATPATRQYGFAHLDDGLVPWSQLQQIWRSLGVLTSAGAVSVDSSTSPYGNSQALTTDARPALGLAADPEHGATVLDSVTPRNPDGSPLFDPVWAYLAFR